MNKILIANRSEIACRIIRTAKKMGIATVAVFSDADRSAPHVIMADEAIYLGDSPSTESYLNQEKIMSAAVQCGAEGIHPGYGFLSENADFAERVIANGLTFIGPSPAAIRMMGSKLAAKEAVRAYDIPMVPGTDEAISDVAQAKNIAEQIGFPILIKASAGGGGKGMRIVHHMEEFEEQLQRAIGEATSAFGDGSVFIEKYIASPKHIEIQVLADNYGNVIHLFERDCSIQRRHQKVIEEAPSTILDEKLRRAMGETAIRVAKSCKYSGAGTVEFLMDTAGNFFFLEMNTRLQVEHPVTECITGLDLVEQQIKVARGEQLNFHQKDINIKGHSIELRIYAEDPAENFAPNIGTLVNYQLPEDLGVRVDNGYRQGMEIPIFYDPMLAKLICYADTRRGAIEKMLTAIDRFQIEGVATTLSFGSYALKHPEFISGNYNTHFIEKNYSRAEIKTEKIETERILSKIALHILMQEKKKLKLPSSLPSNWSTNRRVS